MEYINVDDVMGICKGNKCLFSVKSAKNIKCAFGEKGNKEKCKVAEGIKCLVLQRHQNVIISIEMQSFTASRLNKSPEQ